jgi:predicted nucleotidyltransferase component of viral defense system
MILTQEIRDLVLKWGLRDSVIEKDYVLGWLLWGIASVSELNNYWAFKGGTSLKKCYIDTWRFSEDLDFTVLPGGPTNPKTIEPLIVEVLERVGAASGIDFSIAKPVFKYSEKYIYTEGRIYYRGPLRARRPARVKLDISGLEETVCSTVLRNISHTYSDVFPNKSQIRCYSFEEIFAEMMCQHFFGHFSLKILHPFKFHGRQIIVC